MSEIYCANCVKYQNGKCQDPKGLLHGIPISKSMAEAEHDCKAFKEAVYMLSEASHLKIALADEGVELDFRTAKRVCDRFFERLMKAGMLQKGDKSDGED